MLCNEKTALWTSAVLLVPYSEHHVPTYHAWMKDPDIQHATASDPLTLAEEHSMQHSWRQDPDKLTFIICRPIDEKCPDSITAQTDDGSSLMLGDVNLFLSISDESENAESRVLTAELELMIAEVDQQRRGYGKAALLTFLKYVLENQREIVREFVHGMRLSDEIREISYFCAKIGKENAGSLKLFESLGFRKTSDEASYFGEFELGTMDMNLDEIGSMMQENKISGYAELPYHLADSH